MIVKGFRHIADSGKIPIHQWGSLVTRSDEIYPFVIWVLTHPSHPFAESLKNSETLKFLQDTSAGVCLFYLPIPSESQDLNPDLESKLPGDLKFFFTESLDTARFHEAAKSLKVDMEDALPNLPIAVIASDYLRSGLVVKIGEGASIGTRLNLATLIDAARVACQETLGPVSRRYLEAEEMTGYRRFRDRPEEKVRLLRALKLELRKRKAKSVLTTGPFTVMDLLRVLGLAGGLLGQ